jgi:RNA-splicing ligase RtcB
MTSRSWQASEAKSLPDEAPRAYKPIDVVMRDQADLVQIEGRGEFDRQLQGCGEEVNDGGP